MQKNPRKDWTFLVAKLVNHIGKSLSVALTVGMALMVIMAVFMRYVVRKPILITDEVGGYILVAIVFLGSGAVYLEGGHIRMELVHLSGKRFLLWLRPVLICMSIVFVVIFAAMVWEDIAWTYAHGQYSYTVGAALPLWWPKVPVLAGLVLLLIAMICALIRTVRLLAQKELQEMEK